MSTAASETARTETGHVPVLDCVGVRKSYGSNVAVADFTLRIGRGELWALVGPNGCGKTTSIEAAIGLRARDDGTVHCFGVDPAVSPRSLVGKIGVQLQGAAIHQSIKVREHLEYVAAAFGQRERMADTVEVFRLADELGKQFGKLSGGTQRRVLVAAAYLVRPAFLLLDEPTSGVDPEARIALWSSLVRAARTDDAAVLVTTHDLNEAERYLQRFALMVRGRVIAAGALDDVRHTLETEYVLAIPRDTADPVEPPGMPHRILEDRVLVAGRTPDDLGPTAATSPAGTIRPASLEDLYLLHVSGARRA